MFTVLSICIRLTVRKYIQAYIIILVAHKATGGNGSAMDNVTVATISSNNTNTQQEPLALANKDKRSRHHQYVATIVGKVRRR
jgi:hypothetical protein